MYSTTKRIPKKTRAKVYARDGRACVLCEDDRAVHLHHVVARGKGGNDSVFNLVCLCPVCHRIAHGEYQLDNQFPFDCSTAYDAIFFYLADLYGESFSLMCCLR